MSAREGAPVLRPVGDQALAVEFGRAIDPASSARVRALDDALAASPFEGLRECVPAYASLLVVIDRARVSLEEASARVRERLARAGAAVGGGRRHVLAVVYGGEQGPDLEEVAQQKGMSPAEVVRRHAAAEYTAFFVGFQPGFAYLGLLPAALEMPRRGTPRTRVPAGSVAIAGRQTGVYPSASPGGWHLIGRTHVRLFDPSLDPPALIHPGDRVRFDPVEEMSAPGEAPRQASPNDAGMSAAVEVMEAGLLTSIQDGGRRGLRRWGVPWCGPMDAESHARANRAVGNPPDAPALECTASGPALRFLAPTWFAVAGAFLDPVLERSDLGAWPVPAGVAVLGRPGNVLSFRGRRAGFRCVVALRGGVDVPEVLGSRATDVLNALGGLEGRPLRAGDRLALGGAASAFSTTPAPPAPSGTVTLRVVPGPQEDAFTAGGHETLLAEEYVLGARSDRTGCRLSGPPLTHAGAQEIVTDGMVPGCIQVPPDGQPIVMAADCPTTGGYPKIATVVTADLPLLAQLVPGEGRVRFVLDESRQSTVDSRR